MSTSRMIIFIGLTKSQWKSTELYTKHSPNHSSVLLPSKPTRIMTSSKLSRSAQTTNSYSSLVSATMMNKATCSSKRRMELATILDTEKMTITNHARRLTLRGLYCLTRTLSYLLQTRASSASLTYEDSHQLGMTSSRII